MKRKADEAEAKRNAEAKRKAEEEEQKRKANEEDAKKKTEDAEARRKLFQSEASRRAESSGRSKGRREPVAGGFYVGDHVLAAQDITIRGKLTVRCGSAGVISGPSETDPVSRIAVDFVTRADGVNGCINVVPKEIKKG